MARKDLIEVMIISSSSTRRITGSSFSPMFHLFLDGCALVRDGQINRECGFVSLAFNADPAVMLLNDFVANREPKPRAYSDALCRKSRIKDLRKVLQGDSHTVVGNGNSYRVRLS